MRNFSSMESPFCNLSIDQLQREKQTLTKRLADLRSMIVSLKLYDAGSAKNPNLLEIIEDIERIVGKHKSVTATKF